MPITPFHFGPAAAIHSFAPKHVSFLAFCAANVLIDIEPLYYMLTAQYPLHRFFHTYIGASIIVLATGGLFFAALKLASVAKRLPNFFGWQDLKALPIWLGAAIGSYSHIALDSVMHSDIVPYAPFSEHNSLYRFVTLGELHAFCLLAGVVGIVILGIRRLFRTKYAG